MPVQILFHDPIFTILHTFSVHNIFNLWIIKINLHFFKPGAQHFPPELELQIFTKVTVNTSWNLIERSNNKDVNCRCLNIIVNDEDV